MGYAYFPEEVEEKIVKEHLTTFPQLVALSGVCKSWRSVAHDLCSFPGILVSETSCPRRNYCDDHDCDCTDCRAGERHRCRRSLNLTISRGPHHQFRPISTIFNSTRSHVAPPRLMHGCRTRTRIHLPNIDYDRGGEVSVDLEKCHCIASKDGWLVLVEPRGDSFAVRIFLLNPITGASIPLPLLQLPCDIYRYSNDSEFSSDVILSSSPDKHQDCHLIVLSPDYYNTRQIAWCKVSGGCWKYTPRGSNFFNTVWSACYIGGKLYVVASDKVHVFDNLINVTDHDEVGAYPHPTVRSLALPLCDIARCYWTRYYVMELNSQLIIVLRHYCQEHVVAFQAYKLECDNVCPSNWKEVRSLDGHAVFLGVHQCFCVPVQKNGMIRSDHVYYLDNGCGQCQLEVYHRYGMMDYHNRLLEQIASNLVIPCQNSFDALSLIGD